MNTPGKEAQSANSNKGTAPETNDEVICADTSLPFCAARCTNNSKLQVSFQKREDESKIKMKPKPDSEEKTSET